MFSSSSSFPCMNDRRMRGLRSNPAALNKTSIYLNIYKVTVYVHLVSNCWKSFDMSVNVWMSITNNNNRWTSVGGYDCPHIIVLSHCHRRVFVKVVTENCSCKEKRKKINARQKREVLYSALLTQMLLQITEVLIPGDGSSPTVLLHILYGCLEWCPTCLWPRVPACHPNCVWLS